MKRYETINEAAHAWVMEMNAIPVGVVEKLMGECMDGVIEVTPPRRYDRVVMESIQPGEEGEIKSYDADDDVYVIALDNGDEIEANECDFSMLDYDGLPMWCTMWSFSDGFDNDWLDNGGLRLMAECGFRIYEQEDYGYIFGIDGAGYDFYEEHWIPLYKARGLHWHIVDDRDDPAEEQPRPVKHDDYLIVWVDAIDCWSIYDKRGDKVREPYWGTVLEAAQAIDSGEAL